MKPSLETRAGFSLIELLIVIAIIAILAALAYNSYTRYVMQSRRTDATSALAQAQGILERCYAQSFNYTNAQTGINGCATLGNTWNSPSGYYTLALTVAAQSYTVTATPATGSPQSTDSACQRFIVNSAPGNGTPVRQVLSGSGADDTATCWPQ